MTTLRDFQKAVQQKVKELSARDQHIKSLERQLAEKELQIAELQFELEKYRSLVMTSPSQLVAAHHRQHSHSAVSSPSNSLSSPGMSPGAAALHHMLHSSSSSPIFAHESTSPPSVGGHSGPPSSVNGSGATIKLMPTPARTKQYGGAENGPSRAANKQVASFDTTSGDGNEETEDNGVTDGAATDV